MAIIGKVIRQPANPKAGDSVRIDVCGPNEVPYDNKQPDYVGINGVAGSSQYVQFAFAGEQKVVVTAVDVDGRTEHVTESITIAATEPSAATVRILADPATKTWTQDQIAWLKTVNDVRLLTIAPAAPFNQPCRVLLNLSPLSTFVPESAARTVSTAVPKAEPKTVATPQAEAPATYRWDFGDGSPTVTTSQPSTVHDFTAALGTTEEFRQFHVSISGTRAGETLGPWTRTVCVHNPYVACKKQGNLVLTVAAKGWARKTGSHFVANAEIVNREDAPITLAARVTIAISANEDATPAPAAMETLDPPIELPAKERVSVQISVPFSQVPADSAGFAVVMTEGKAIEPAKDGPLAGLKIRATGYFRLSPRPGVKHAPEKSGSDGATHDDHGITAGDPCDPDNLPETIPPGMVCQVTSQTETVGLPARFLNARKGDVVLCPSVGSSSLVDGIFAQLVPQQQYGHTGIMTRDYEQITHCTASQSRMETYGVGGLLASNDEGLDPDVVKYGWPGTITETVDKAVNGDYYTDPASATEQQYQLQSFNGSFSALPCGSSLMLIPPRVVKPDPLLETAAVRRTLTDVADDAFAHTGKFHYRFFSFTDPAHAADAPASGLDAPSTWAEGTHAGVCSAFVWKMMKGRGVHAVGASPFATEDELSHYAKTVLGLSVDPAGGTEDGLFFYSEEQRTICGLWLWQQVHNLAAGQAGSFGEWLTGAGNYYANQICNTFAADDAATPSPLPVNQPWQSPGGGNAISPSNFLAWIGPDKGGVLGYSEPLSFEPATVATVPVYKWAKVTEYGRVTGRVISGSKPVERVTLTLPGLQAGSDKDGNYVFEKVPYGPCLIKAMLATEAPTGATVDSVGQARLTVDKASQDAPEIKLRRPDDPFVRTVGITGHCSLDCSEWSWGSNHYTAWPELAGQIDVGLGHTDDSWSQTETSKDATAVFSATLHYNDDDDSVDVVFTAALDQPGGQSLTYAANVAADRSHSFVIGNPASWLNGTGPQKWTYDGVPDLEAKNDTLCSSLTFTNKVWTG